MPIRLSFYTLPGVPRNGLVGSHISSVYSNIEDLWDGHLDGLIVTGREPMAANLSDEPYWESFTKVLAWAQENCSCDGLVVPGGPRRDSPHGRYSPGEEE